MTRISRTRLLWTLPCILACTLVALPLHSCSGGDSDEKAPPPAAPEVEFVHPLGRNVTSYLEYTGNTEAFATVQLQARVQGFLEKVNFVEGALVKRGDLLFVIEKSQYQAAVSKAQADLEAAHAAFFGAQADAQLAAELASQQAGPEIDRIIKAAKRDAAQASIAEAQAALDRALIDLGYTEIRSPIDGRISSRQVDVGNLVGRGETTLLATVYQVSPIYVSVSVSEADMLAARRRAQASGRALSAADPAASNPVPVFVALPDEDTFSTQGRIDYIDPTLNRATGTIGLRLLFDNENNFLVPGLFVRVRFELANTEQLVIPQAAILQDQTGHYVLVLDDQDAVARRQIKVGQTDGTDQVVTEGLAPADRVIVSGQLKAKPGTTVTPKPAPPPPTAPESGTAPATSPQKP